MIRRPPISTLFPTRRSSDLDDRASHEAVLPPFLGVRERLAVPRACLGSVQPLCHARTSAPSRARAGRSEEHTSELQSHVNLVCRLLLEKKKYRRSQGLDRGM